VSVKIELRENFVQSAIEIEAKVFMIAAKLAEHFIALGAKKIQSRRDLTSASHLNYAIINGENILAIGEGTPARLKGLMGEAACPKHTKAFIVAASYVIHGPHLQFFAFSAENKSAARDLEDELKAHFPSLFFHDAPTLTELRDAGNHLLHRLAPKLDSMGLSSQLVSDLRAALEIVTYDGDALNIIYKIEKYRPHINKLLGHYYR